MNATFNMFIAVLKLKSADKEFENFQQSSLRLKIVFANLG